MTVEPSVPPGVGDLVVAGGRVLGPEGQVTDGDVVVRTGRVESVRSSPTADAPAERSARTLDASGKLVVPGFVDLQCNGAHGIDLTAEPERIWDVATVLPRWGVTAWLPTFVTSPDSIRRRAQAAFRSGPVDAEAWRGSIPLGLHFEGPFLSPERRGAHAVEYLQRPTVRAVDGWSAADGVAVVTLAPELPGALDVLRTLVRRGVIVSLGHSSATVAEATAAVDAGASWVTHLFNTMAPLHHREPGLAAVALTDERLRVGLIVDGHHVHPTAVDLAYRLLGPRLTLVTDAVAALGVPPGIVRLGDVEALADAESVRIAGGTLAGSMLSMDRAVGNLQEFAGCGLAEAVAAASTEPCRLLGQAGERGVIQPGARGDLVLLDGAEVATTIIGGDVVYQR